MNKINPESLKRNVYEYLKYCKQNRTVRGVGIITSKQFVFYSQVGQSDYMTHDELMVTIEQLIHPIERTGWDAIRPQDASLALIGNTIFFYLPDTEELTYSQFEFLNKVLDQIEKYNQEVELKEHARLICYKKEELDTQNVESMRKKLETHISKSFSLEEERIIGETLTKEQIIKTMQDQLNIKSCKTLDDFVLCLVQCEEYKMDSYFQPYFDEMFQDYQEIKQYIIFLKSVAKENISIKVEISLKETLLNVIKKLFFDQKNIFERINFLRKLKYFGITFSDEFLKYEEIIRLSIYYKKEDMPESLSYEEFATAFFWEVYETMEKTITSQKKILEFQERSLKKYKLQEILWKEKDALVPLVEEAKRVQSLLQTAKEENSICMNIKEIQEEKINKLDQELAMCSSNILKKIIYYQKRKRLKRVKEATQEEIKNIDIRRNELAKTRMNLEQKEKQFQEMLLQKNIDVQLEQLEFILLTLTEPDLQKQTLMAQLSESTKSEIKALEEEMVKISENPFFKLNEEKRYL